MPELIMKHPVIFEYLDYRSFLQDMFTFRKEQTKYFSYRYFSSKSGFKSPNFLKLVMQGVRNLTAESIAKISKGFDLKKQEREYFEYLVLMNQAKTHEEKNVYYRRMISAKGYKDIRKLESAEYEYFSKWYYPVIREILMFGDRRHTPEEVSQMLNPPIAVNDAHKAIQLLSELDFVYQDEQGRWAQKNRNMSTGPEVKSLVVANYHREMLKLASESLERYPAKERDISALVLSIRQERMADIKQKIADFRKQLLEMASDEAPDQVVQVNIQVFPLTVKM
jgi:uncharacterized protein (TIGR02147 family)